MNSMFGSRNMLCCIKSSQSAGLLLRPTTHRLNTIKPVHLRYNSTSQGQGSNVFVRYWQSLKWVPIPLGVGFCYISYQQFGHVVKREERLIKNASSAEEIAAKDWQVRVYTTLPLKMMSRLWGQVNSLTVPMWMREPFYKLYIWAFNVNLEEAAIRDLKHYKNLGEFFNRSLAKGVRPVDKTHPLTCPSDGKVLHFGKIERGLVEQVKGLTYSLKDFLGPANWPSKDNLTPNHPNTVNHDNMSNLEYENRTRIGKETELYHCVIYLAPGDYHGFHSPTQWQVMYRRHFPGELLSVNPGIARWIRGLFNLNERAVYMGEWQHGFFSMIAVGATNVGSMKIFMDEDLATNVKGPQPPHIDVCFTCEERGGGIPMNKGEAFGEFKLGSTIVLVFEAPKDFEFKISEGQKVKYGEPLGIIPAIKAG